MRKALIVIAIASSVLSACRHYQDYENVAWEDKALPDWENTAVNTLNTEKPHASIVSFPDNLRH